LRLIDYGLFADLGKKPKDRKTFFRKHFLPLNTKKLLNYTVFFIKALLTDNIDFTHQSTTYGGRGPERAIDGNLNNHQHTSYADDPRMFSFWKAVFVSRMYVSRVYFLNRGDCCVERGDNLNITLRSKHGERHHDMVCGNTGLFPRTAPPRELWMTCEGFADEMIVQTTVAGQDLSFAEIQIYGSPCN